MKTTPQELTKLPLIVVEEIDDKLIDNTLGYKQGKYRKTIEVNIYATDVPTGTASIAKQIVADELKILVDEVLSDECHMSRMSCNETPNADRNIFRLTIRYRCIVDENNIIYGGKV